MNTASADRPITIEELRRMAAGRFGDMVKGVVDLERGIILRPSFGNATRGVDDPAIRGRIVALVNRLVRR